MGTLGAAAQDRADVDAQVAAGTVMPRVSRSVARIIKLVTIANYDAIYDRNRGVSYYYACIVN